MGKNYGFEISADGSVWMGKFDHGYKDGQGLQIKEEDYSLITY